MPPIARGQAWLYQPSPVSTVPNTGRNQSNSNYRGLDEEEEGMGCGNSFCLGGRHFQIPNGNQILSAPISLKNDIPCTIMPVSFAIISMRLYPCDTAFAACNITRMVTWHQLFRHISVWHRTPNTFASRVDITSAFNHRIRSEQWLLADNVTIPHCCLRSADRFQFLGNFPFPSCRIRCLIPAPLLYLVVAYKPSGRLRSHRTSTLLVLANCVSIWYHLIGVVTE